MFKRDPKDQKIASPNCTNSGANSRANEHYPLAVAMLEFSRFLDSALGVELMAIEKKYCCEQLASIAGYIGIQISLGRDSRLLSDTIGHTLALGYAPTSSANEDAWIDLRELPVAHDCADVVLLHHALEFVDEPTQLLREADRTLKAGGHLIIFSFNLLGVWPFYSRYWAWKNQVRWRRQPALRQGRVHDWLTALNYDIVRSDQLLSRGPINSALWVARTRWFERWVRRLRLPIGMVHCTVARKRSVPLNPVSTRPWVNALHGGARTASTNRTANRGKAACRPMQSSAMDR